MMRGWSCIFAAMDAKACISSSKKITPKASMTSSKALPSPPKKKKLAFQTLIINPALLEKNTLPPPKRDTLKSLS